MASISAGADKAPQHYYNASLSNTVVDIFPSTGAKGNLYGFTFDNNSATNDVFIQIFDKKSSDVTLGSTVPDFTFRIPASGFLGKDAQDLVLHFFANGFSIACTGARADASAPNAACSVNLWHWAHPQA